MRILTPLFQLEDAAFIGPAQLSISTCRGAPIASSERGEKELVRVALRLVRLTGLFRYSFDHTLQKRLLQGLLMQALSLSATVAYTRPWAGTPEPSAMRGSNVCTATRQ